MSLTHLNNNRASKEYWLPECSKCKHVGSWRRFGDKKEDAIPLCESHYKQELRKFKLEKLCQTDFQNQ